MNIVTVARIIQATINKIETTLCEKCRSNCKTIFQGYVMSALAKEMAKEEAKKQKP